MGKREDNKQRIKQSIVTNAWQLFSESSFNDVKVADIAKAANISVKTLFTYFNSKEDIIFDDQEELINIIIAKLDDVNQSQYFTVLEKHIIEEFGEDDADLRDDDTKSLIRMISNNPTISGRLNQMWLEYEYVIRQYLAEKQQLSVNDAQITVMSAQLILPYRLLVEHLIMLLTDGHKINLVDLRKWMHELFITLTK
ncbi:TetR/AcrR family transcriptional regulator [Dellaglioa carnosa]|uniref:TetR/AcrR family transcriptional regulator n=1 Tax=Dellaglioa carnosa TaxID=2995136 RepID=A0ABT4JM16_9LACO|nr:TetR/AcrR family transcriptional regulator [Dellaglioa carnosa]MCZ2491410.1 TetR/AcrR family transcriptional regulator [Dellaglioa carnosa]MCZ2494488.1 TetR/AcrR family transcriptional regulator [Dellaglioa carnosa]MDK1731096.1 TetR/AcrR family transcriptional regulator [Dellaglioa carnosa]